MNNYVIGFAASLVEELQNKSSSLPLRWSKNYEVNN